MQNGARNPTVPAASAQMGGIGSESSKYEAAFSTVPSLVNGEDDVETR